MRTATTRSPSGCLEPSDRGGGAHVSAALLNLRGHRLVELPHAEARVAVLTRVRANRRVTEAHHAKSRVAEVQQRDALGRPVRGDPVRRDPPELLGVGAEERVVQRPSEPRGDPVLEGDVGRVGETHCSDAGACIADEGAGVLAPAEVREEIARLERILERAPLVKDDALAASREQLVAQEPLEPSRELHVRRDEAMAAEVEAVPPLLVGRAKPAHLRLLLEDDDGLPPVREVPRRREAARAATENDERRHGRRHRARATSPSPWGEEGVGLEAAHADGELRERVSSRARFMYAAASAATCGSTACSGLTLDEELRVRAAAPRELDVVADLLEDA